MKTLIITLCLLLAMPSLAQTKTPEDLRKEIDDLPGVEKAIIQTDDEGNMVTEPRIPVIVIEDGKRVAKPMKDTEGYLKAAITYIYKLDGVSSDNTVAIAIEPDGSASWYGRLPSLLAQASPPPSAGKDSDIVDAIESSQNVVLITWSISHDERGADVVAVIEIDGKLVERRYRAVPDGESWGIKPYEVSTDATKTETAR